MAGNVADVVPKPRPERAGQGAAALLLGITGTAAGTGIATAHLAKAGLDAAAALAVIVLATGLFLLGWGGVALVRAIPGWWRLLAVPAALALLVSWTTRSALIADPGGSSGRGDLLDSFAEDPPSAFVLVGEHRAGR